MLLKLELASATFATAWLPRPVSIAEAGMEEALASCGRAAEVVVEEVGATEIEELSYASVPGLDAAALRRRGSSADTDADRDDSMATGTSQS